MNIVHISLCFLQLRGLFADTRTIFDDPVVVEDQCICPLAEGETAAVDNCGTSRRGCTGRSCYLFLNDGLPWDDDVNCDPSFSGEYCGCHEDFTNFWPPECEGQRESGPGGLIWVDGFKFKEDMSEHNCKDYGWTSVSAVIGGQAVRCNLDVVRTKMYEKTEDDVEEDPVGGIQPGYGGGRPVGVRMIDCNRV
mmetsp:Transcript_22494/g.38570  ORF Transcript_22494/g.38570 Transcript_22494/m.38570 type:complete len:193 (+) Transcript_22494:167-745(+)|eukprot:CAMPEP_0183749480 /NCGR_PEP_ID=MMETSP0737-20130205/68307_1 /TAXON_ID=385413 /ORGANISM="Thalassiosira miniscula, Strain CCMP1093" /LENGTH=192 /DNA_ID=CAMNT_0025985237 /DNA_START=75 /DNA_END=653 /DNA_ORIENTATION=+